MRNFLGGLIGTLRVRSKTVKLWASTAEKLSKAFKPPHNSNIFYIPVQNNAELEQSRLMAESPREILSSNGKISPAHKIGFEN